MNELGTAHGGRHWDVVNPNGSHEQMCPHRSSFETLDPNGKGQHFSRQADHNEMPGILPSDSDAAGERALAIYTMPGTTKGILADIVDSMAKGIRSINMPQAAVELKPANRAAGGMPRFSLCQVPRQEEVYAI